MFTEVWMECVISLIKCFPFFYLITTHVSQISVKLPESISLLFNLSIFRRFVMMTVSMGFALNLGRWSWSSTCWMSTDGCKEKYFTSFWYLLLHLWVYGKCSHKSMFVKFTLKPQDKAQVCHAYFELHKFKLAAESEKGLKLIHSFIFCLIWSQKKKSDWISWSCKKMSY